jgi:hypothetical protein
MVAAVAWAAGALLSGVKATDTGAAGAVLALEAVLMGVGAVEVQLM